MKPGETKFRASLRRLRRSRFPRLTPAQWFKIALAVLSIAAALLGIEGELLQDLVELLLK